jgi:CubicO group peptidase (beta-lactamase class C family)
MSHEVSQIPIEAELDALFGAYVAAGQAPGLVYGLIGPSGLVHAAGFGTANDDGDCPDIDTVYPIASMTKSFVACAALAARDRGLIDLEAPISDFFGEFRALLPDGSPCRAPSIRSLLAMGGGLTEDNAWVDPFIGTPVAPLLETIARGVTLSRPPGVAYEYSNIGFALAGLAVGKAVGMPIERWVTTEILRPLGLAGTRFDNDTQPWAGAATAHDGPADPAPGPALGAGRVRATGYHLDPTGCWVGYPPATSDAFAAAGGIESTVRDLATWVTWLAAALRPAAAGHGVRDTGEGAPDDGPVSRASRQEMQRLHQIDLPSLAIRPDGDLQIRVAGYGLGLMVAEDFHRGTIVMHSGGLPGFTVNMTWHPDSGHGIVVLTNSHRGNPVELSGQALARVLSRHRTPARAIRLRPETAALQRQADALIRSWDDLAAGRIFAPNIAFDRPLDERRAAIDRLIGEVGPLRNAPPADAATDIVAATSPADVTWSIPAERGELLCFIHITSTAPAQIQEFEVQAARYGTPRSARPQAVSLRQARLGVAWLSSASATAVEWPAP